MNGDATIITRVNSLDSSNDNAKVGLIFRESLDSGSDLIGVYGHNSGMTHSSWRGQNLVNNDLLSENGSSTNSYRDEAMPAWLKIEIYGNRVSTFYAPDSASEPLDEMWSPVSTAFHDTSNNFYIGLFASSSDNNIVTGVFSQMQILTDDGTVSPPTSNTFVPDPNKSYYIDSPVHNLRIGATGNSEDPFTTSTNTTGDNVEWKFTSNGDAWHIDRVAGGSLPRLRTDNTEFADMQSTDFDGRWELFTFTEGASNGTYFVSSFNGPEGFRRLQVDRDGNVNMVPLSLDGSWESFTFTEVAPATSVVHITKRNATGFAIDGGIGGENGQSVSLSSANTSDEGQLWLEIDRGNGFYSYEKFGTNYSLDGNRDGADNQEVYLWETNDTNQNQQWEKEDQGDGSYKLIKRNATGFVINGGSGGLEGRGITLFSNVNSQNLQWYITPVATNVRLEAENYNAMTGIQAENTQDINGGENVGFIDNGDWLRFDDINLSGITNMDARIATRTSGGSIEVRTGSPTGALIGSINVDNTGGFQNWSTSNTAINNTVGIQDVYLVFTGGNGYLYNINWVEFNTNSTSSKDVATVTKLTDVIIYPNPILNSTTIEGAENSTIVIYDMNGAKVLTASISSESEIIDLSALVTGVYYAKIEAQAEVSVIKLVKQ